MDDLDGQGRAASACMHGSYCAELRCAVYILYVLLRVNLIWSNANANANANRYPMHAIKRHTVTVDSAQTVALIHQFICSIESCNHLHGDGRRRFTRGRSSSSACMRSEELLLQVALSMQAAQQPNCHC